jgi:hypothetical protein
MLMEIFGYIVNEIIVSFIGWVRLYVWYRDSKKVEEVKRNSMPDHSTLLVEY